MSEPRNYTHTSDPADLENNSASSLSLTTIATQTGELELGIYDVWATDKCFIKVGKTADDVTDSTGYVIFAGNVVPVVIRKDRKIGGVTASGTSTLYYHKVG